MTVSADNAEDATAEVAVTVLDRVQASSSDPVSPPLASFFFDTGVCGVVVSWRNGKRVALAFRGAVGGDTGVARSDDGSDIDARIGTHTMWAG